MFIMLSVTMLFIGIKFIHSVSIDIFFLKWDNFIWYYCQCVDLLNKIQPTLAKLIHNVFIRITGLGYSLLNGPSASLTVLEAIHLSLYCRSVIYLPMIILPMGRFIYKMLSILSHISSDIQYFAVSNMVYFFIWQCRDPSCILDTTLYIRLTGS